MKLNSFTNRETEREKKGKERKDERKVGHLKKER
jgi:hypothetical protein